MEQPFQPLNNLPLTTLIAGASKIGGSEGRLIERRAAGFARENEEITCNVGKGTNDDWKGMEEEVRYFQRATGERGARSLLQVRT